MIPQALPGLVIEVHFLFHRGYDTRATPKVDKIIMEREDFIEALQKLDEAVGEVE